LNNGYLQQVDTPRRMYDHPNNLFVAGFIGSPAMNIVEVPVVDGGVQFGGSVYPVARDVLSETELSRVSLGVRPEDLTLTESGDGLSVEVNLVEELGAHAYVYDSTRLGDTEHEIIARRDGPQPPANGETGNCRAAHGDEHLS